MAGPRIWSAHAGSGSSPDPYTQIGRAGSNAITNGQNSVSVTFSSDIGTTNYAITASIRNTTDADPIMLQIVDTAKATSGFTATFNAPADSANYFLEWSVDKYL